ncbi:MAG: CBS domain-containing protein [Desulfuromonadales bacterium]|nr:CBS domain-containing protein [Desulfuromonadales bacterium]
MERTIGELASRPVISVEAETPVIEALKLMSAQRISCIVVLLKGEPVGILTERDVVFAANWVIGQPALRIREVMSKPVLTASSELTVEDAYRLFRENGIRHLVVLGEQMELAGIFTQTDLVRALGGSIFSEDQKVSLLMSSQVRHVSPEVNARHALSLMASHAISGVVVIEGKSPIGVFTERDVVRLVAAGADLSSLSVDMVMTSPIVTIATSALPTHAIDLMRSHDVRRLLVVDEAGVLAGVLTQTDLSRILDHRESVLADRLVGQAKPFEHGAGLPVN